MCVCVRVSRPPQGRWVSVRSPKSAALHNHIVAGEMVLFRNRMSRFDMFVRHGVVDVPVMSTGEGAGPTPVPRLSTPHLGVGDCVWLQVQLCNSNPRYPVCVCVLCCRRHHTLSCVPLAPPPTACDCDCAGQGVALACVCFSCM